MLSDDKDSEYNQHWFSDFNYEENLINPFYENKKSTLKWIKSEESKKWIFKKVTDLINVTNLYYSSNDSDIKIWVSDVTPSPLHNYEHKKIEMEDIIDILRKEQYRNSLKKLNYKIIKSRIEPFLKELMEKCFHPDRFKYYLYEYGYDINVDEYEYF